MNFPSHIVHELQYFVGKVCSIVTPYVTGNFSLDNKRYIDYFVGRVDAINEQCVWVTHLVTGTKSVFFDVIAIAEEQVIGPDDPDYEKFKDQTSKKPKPELVQLGGLNKR